jgi:hypothetical protein
MTFWIWHPRSVADPETPPRNVGSGFRRAFALEITS